MLIYNSYINGDFNILLVNQYGLKINLRLDKNIWENILELVIFPYQITDWFGSSVKLFLIF